MFILFRDSLANAKQPPLNLNGLGLYYVAARLTRNKSEDSSCKATSSFKNRNLPQAKGGTRGVGRWRVASPSACRLTNKLICHKPWRRNG